MSLADFIILDTIGKGSFGTVLKCLRKVDKQVYAIKQIDIKNMPEKERKNALNEVRILASVQHPNVIEYKEAFFDESSGKLFIVMQYANEGDLSDKIKTNLKSYKRFSQKQIVSVAYESLLGLSKLHAINIMHRDIKCANIFFHNSSVKIGDLNIAKHMKDPFTCTQTGTPYYASPQIWNQMPYSFSSDIWSLGCVLYQMTMLKAPFRAKTTDQLYTKVTSGNYNEITAIYSKQLRNLIGKCLSVHQKNRTSAEDLLNQPIFDQLKSRKLNFFRAINNPDFLIDTIIISDDLQQLNKVLPKSNYNKKIRISKQLPRGHQNYQYPKTQRLIIPTLSNVSSEKILSSKHTINLALSPRKYEFKEGRKPSAKLINIISKQKITQNL